jgi:hypothetical protein
MMTGGQKTAIRTSSPDRTVSSGRWCSHREELAAIRKALRATLEE